MNWTLWFLLLSGWKVFAFFAAFTVTAMILLSVVMTRMTAASPVRNMLLALAFLTVVTAALLGLVTLMTRT